MLLYVKRAASKPYDDGKSASIDKRDDELVKVDELKGVFATLVFSLPSAHWGGAVIVSHDGQRHSLQTYGHEYLAW